MLWWGRAAQPTQAFDASACQPTWPRRPQNRTRISQVGWQALLRFFRPFSDRVESMKKRQPKRSALPDEASRQFAWQQIWRIGKQDAPPKLDEPSSFGHTQTAPWWGVDVWVRERYNGRQGDDRQIAIWRNDITRWGARAPLTNSAGSTPPAMLTLPRTRGGDRGSRSTELEFLSAWQMAFFCTLVMVRSEIFS